MFAYERVCKVECAAGYRNRFETKKIICTEDSVTGDPRICGFAQETNKWKEGTRSTDTNGNCQRMVRVPQAAADCAGASGHDGRD